jgi:hypothetical protein
MSKHHLTTHTKPTACPHCSRLIDAATSILGKHRPQAGDLTIRVGCGSMLVFASDQGDLRTIRDTDLRNYPPALIAAARRAQELVQKKRPQ